MTTPVTPAPTGVKPTSIKVEPWSDFPRQSYSIHGDDFAHSKPFVAKFTAKGSRSTLNIKQTVSQTKQGGLNVEDDVKLWFDLPSQRSLYTRVKSSSYIKVHYDHGICQSNGKDWNCYASFLTNKTVTQSSFRFGAASLHPKCNSDNRFKVDISSGDHKVYWYNRTLSNFNQFKLGLVSVVNLSNKVLQKNNLLLGYSINKNNQAFLRLQNKGFRTLNPAWNNIKQLWDTVTLNYVGKIDSKTKYGIQAAWNINENKIQNVEGVVETKIPNHGVTLKLKANLKQDIALVVKRALWGAEDIAIFSVGLGATNSFTDKRSIKKGLQIDFNI